MFAPPQTMVFNTRATRCSTREGGRAVSRSRRRWPRSVRAAGRVGASPPRARRGGQEGRRGRGRATNFPVVAAKSRGRGSETSSLTYVPQVGGHRETNAAKKSGAGKCSPNVSMQSVDTKSYANAVKMSRLSRADADAALAAVDMHAMDMHESPSGANLDRHEAALAAAVAAHLAVPGGGAGARARRGRRRGERARPRAVPRSARLRPPGRRGEREAPRRRSPRSAAWARSRAATARAPTRAAGAAATGATARGVRRRRKRLGDVGAQSTRAPTYGLTDDAVKDHHHREMARDFLAEPGASGKPILEHGAAGGEDHRRDDDEDETDALGTFRDWIDEDVVLGSGDPMKVDPLDTRLAAQKMGRTDSMNRVASMERMAKRSARGDHGVRERRGVEKFFVAAREKPETLARAQSKGAPSTRGFPRRETRQAVLISRRT